MDGFQTILIETSILDHITVLCFNLGNRIELFSLKKTCLEKLMMKKKVAKSLRLLSMLTCCQVFVTIIKHIIKQEQRTFTNKNLTFWMSVGSLKKSTSSNAKQSWSLFNSNGMLWPETIKKLGSSSTLCT